VGGIGGIGGMGGMGVVGGMGASATPSVPGSSAGHPGVARASVCVPVHEGIVTAIVLAQASSEFAAPVGASCSYDGSVAVWHCNSGHVLARLEGHVFRPWGLALVDSRAARQEHDVWLEGLELWAPAEGRREGGRARGRERSVAFETWREVGSWDDVSSLLPLQERAAVAPPAAGTAPADAPRWTKIEPVPARPSFVERDSRALALLSRLVLVTGDIEGGVLHWDCELAKPRWYVRALGDQCTRVHVDVVSGWVVASSHTLGTITLLRLRDGMRMWDLKTHPARTRCLGFAVDDVAGLIAVVNQDTADAAVSCAITPLYGAHAGQVLATLDLSASPGAPFGQALRRALDPSSGDSPAAAAAAPWPHDIHPVGAHVALRGGILYIAILTPGLGPRFVAVRGGRVARTLQSRSLDRLLPTATADSPLAAVPPCSIA
jgi:hypothetical protein